jgi:O-antigen ligase
MKWLLPFCVILIMPFIYLKSTIDPALVPRFLYLAVVMIIFILIFLLNIIKNKTATDYTFLRHKLFIVICAYIIISIIAVTVASNKSEAIFDLLRTMLGLILFLVATITFTKYDNSLRIFSNIVIMSTFILCSIGFCQYFNIAFESIQGGGALTSTMANKNIFTSIICIALPFTFYGLTENNKYWKAFSLLVALFILFLIIVSQTRATWLALIIASFVCTSLYLLWNRSKNQKKLNIQNKRFKLIPLLVSVLIMITLIGAAVLSNQGIQKTFRRAQSIFDPNESSNSIRLKLWNTSIKMFSEKPILGVGLGNWKITALKYGPVGKVQLAESRFFQRPHNDYLWVLTESGCLGLLTYLVIMIFVFYYAFRILSKCNDGKQVKITLLLLFGLIAYIVDAFFSFPRERIVLLSYSMLIMAGIFSIYHRSAPPSGKTSKNIVVVILSLSLMISMFSVYIGIIRIRSEMHTNTALKWRESGSWHKVIEEINIAETGFSTLDPTATPLSWYRGEAHFMLGNYEEAFSDYKRALLQHPNHMHVLNNLATCYELRGFHDRAIEYYRQAILVYPGFDDALINLAAVLYNIEQFQEASDIIHRVSTRCKDERLPIFREKIDEKLNLLN